MHGRRKERGGGKEGGEVMGRGGVDEEGMNRLYGADR